MDQVTWTREHDRLIAERIERLTVDDQYLPPLYVVNRGPDVPFEHRYEMVASYSKDLLACYRAAETARKNDPALRWALDSPWYENDYHDAQLHKRSDEGHTIKYVGQGNEASEAFARALLQLAERTPSEKTTD